MHQSLCNPKISTLLKVIRKGFLKGCTNLSDKLILKYMNPSSATTKRHMKRPRHGIWSTQPKPTAPTIAPVPIMPHLPLHNADHAFPAKLHPDTPRKEPLCAMTLKNPLPMYFASEHLLIDILASSTMT
jgi:hypothetical protein